MAKTAKETTINLRVDAKTKKQAEKIFARCGYTTSSAIRLFLLRTIKENDWPFDVHIPKLGPDELGPISGPYENLDKLFASLESDEPEEVKPKANRTSKRSAKR